MANFNELSYWEPTIYELEITDAVLGGPSGISNLTRQQLTNRTRKIYDELALNSVYIDSGAFAYAGQNIDILAVFEGSVVDGNVVYFHDGNARYEQAIADGSDAGIFVGVADVTNSRVISGGLLGSPVITGSPLKGDIIYLSSTVAGAMTTGASTVAMGKYLATNLMSLNSGVGGAGGAYDHEQDSYRMLLDGSYFFNGTFDTLIDDSFLSINNMGLDLANNKLVFTAGQSFTTIDLVDPLTSLTVTQAFVSIDFDDTGTPTIEVNAGGGWEPALNNMVHIFSATGSSLQIRFTGSGTGEVRSYAALYNPDPVQSASIRAIEHSAITDDEPQKHYLESAIRHSIIVDDQPTKHRLINDAGISTTELWSSSKINSVGGSSSKLGDEPFRIEPGITMSGYGQSGTLWRTLQHKHNVIVADRYYMAQWHYHKSTDPAYLICTGLMTGTAEDIRINFGGSTASSGFINGTNIPFTLILNASVVGLGWQTLKLDHIVGFAATQVITNLNFYWNTVGATL